MRVNDERKAKTVPFKSIKVGEPFADEEGDFMMRTKDITDATGEICNVVSLETGYIYSFNAEESVIRINRASLTIYD